MNEAMNVLNSMNYIESMGLDSAGTLVVIAWSIFKWGSMLFCGWRMIRRIRISKK